MKDLDKHFDALVVGSGPSGSIAAKELTERGLEVLLLEAGPDVTRDDFKPPARGRTRPLGISLGPRVRAALRGQHIQARRYFWSEQVGRFLVNDRQNPYSTPTDEYFLWIRSRQLGGRLHSYGRVLQRMSDHDFRGATLGGNGADWPITYADLEPWYEQIEDLVGIYGNTDGVKEVPDSNYCGPGILNSLELAFKEQVEGRWPKRKVISWRYAAPNPDRVPLGILAARKTGRLTERTDAVVKQITVDHRSGRADGAVFIDRLTKREHRVRADVVVLCASPIETVRLLLLSGSQEHPDGLANSSGLVGKYFMDQCPSLVFATLPGKDLPKTENPAPPDPYYSPAGGIVIPRFTDESANDLHPGFRGFGYQGVIGRAQVPPGHPPAFGLSGFSELAPRRDNYVTLDRKRTDAWGVPVAYIRCVASDDERKQLRQQVSTATEMVEAFGGRVNFAGSLLGLQSRDVFPDADPISRAIFRHEFVKSLAMGAAIHECGGTRMGTDPKQSVLNEYCQSWDVPNLFITDASCFVSNGMVGPTLTIMALTARTCEYIATEHGATNLRTASA